MGKHKPTYSQTSDNGDHVVIVNAAKIKFTGRKWQQKIYHRHSGYPGGLKRIKAAQWRAEYPERIIRSAVYGMLRKNAHKKGRMRRLRVYGGPEHPHATQLGDPSQLELVHADYNLITDAVKEAGAIEPEDGVWYYAGGQFAESAEDIAEEAPLLEELASLDAPLERVH
jgi:large subunit ribosomal protein L13